MSINDTKKDMKEVEEEKKYEQQDSTIEQVSGAILIFF